MLTAGGDQADEGAEQAEGDDGGKEGVAECGHRRAAGPCGATHTFSTSARPRIPVGMKISTTIRIENAATSLYSTLK